MNQTKTLTDLFADALTPHVVPMHGFLQGPFLSVDAVFKEFREVVLPQIASEKAGAEWKAKDETSSLTAERFEILVHALSSGVTLGNWSKNKESILAFCDEAILERKKCKLERQARCQHVWELAPGTGGLIDRCQLCGEERA